MSNATKIRMLNDNFRQTLAGGTVFITPGVAALGAHEVEDLFRMLCVYDEFCQANDPYNEHDFGAIDLAGKKVFFQISYYDVNKEFGSPDPADPSVTQRVITIMLAEEY